LPQDADLVHFPYFDPFFLTLPPNARTPFVVTVHDLTPLVFPQHFPRGIRGEIKWQIQKRALRAARHVITDSEASKGDVVRLVRLPEDRITAVHLAANPDIQRVSDKKQLAAVGKKLTLPQKFFLYVGDLNWNKNVQGLLSAFAEVRQRHREVHLVLVGGAFQNADLAEAHAVSGAIEGLGLTGFVHKVGRLTDLELSCVYSTALACIQPSHYEGFGFPVLEAMACGCPVVAASGSSLDEIAGPAIRVSPADTKSIADGMMRVIAVSPTARQALISEGDAWGAQFTWERVARETVAVYEKASPLRQ
jgi:glycosyltransferase involved in cell wall biosynthesis